MIEDYVKQRRKELMALHQQYSEEVKKIEVAYSELELLIKTMGKEETKKQEKPKKGGK